MVNRSFTTVFVRKSWLWAQKPQAQTPIEW